MQMSRMKDGKEQMRVLARHQLTFEWSAEFEAPPIYDTLRSAFLAQSPLFFGDAGWCQITAFVESRMPMLNGITVELRGVEAP